MLTNKVLHHSLRRLKSRRILFSKQQHTAPKTTPVSSDDLTTVRPVFRYANEYAEHVAIHDNLGEFTYRSLFNASLKLSKDINKALGYKPNERVAFLCPNDSSYVITQWASWMAGQTVVPLSKLHPPSMLEYFITDSNANLLVTTEEHSELLTSISKKSKSKLLVLDNELINLAIVKREDKFTEKTDSKEKEKEKVVLPPLDAGLEPEFYQDSNAMILYTSGTTGPPKGVVLSHRNVHSQVLSMITAWGWTGKDVILHMLPLHHTHGIINALITPLSTGAKVLMLPKFNANEAWSHLLAVKKHSSDRVNIFMGVPTMYAKLIEEYDTLFLNNKRQVDFIKTHMMQKIRLMISGSAALPGPIMERWKDISGHVLLERYGMTETGMVLSNPLEGERRTGFVGQPMPYVNVKIVSKDDPSKVLVEGNHSNSSVVSPPQTDSPISGDLLVKGPTIFNAYWNKPNATAKEFPEPGWFKTGDTAEYVDGSYRILGRSSVDIIKTGGYKISALQVETVLLGHEDIRDVAVMGVPDATWGEKITAVVVFKEDKTLELPQIREWCKQKLAPYAVPTALKVVESIPRNQMGKVNKKELLKTLFAVK